jgi:hypothetical protein
VRGNHEDYVLDFTSPETTSGGPVFEIARSGYWTYQQLNGRVDQLQAMPFQVSFAGPDGREFRVVHASMRSNRDGIFPKTSDGELRQLIAPAPSVLCVGHTHRPLVRHIDNTLVVNVGSVGMPFDGDPRTGYAQLNWLAGQWRARIIRLAYDREQTVRDFFECGFIPGAGSLADLMLVELQRARSYIHLWGWQYEQSVLAGEISIDASVKAFMNENSLSRP